MLLAWCLFSQKTQHLTHVYSRHINFGRQSDKHFLGIKFSVSVFRATNFASVSLERGMILVKSLSFHRNIVTKFAMSTGYELVEKQFKVLPATSEDRMLKNIRKIVPSLTSVKHKGQSGRIGIFGGSPEFTGAPYFAGMCALRIGADLVHVFCAREAGIPIKSYSPELMVHPILDSREAIKLIKPWLDRLHVILIGTGLGRSEETFKTISNLITICREMRKPLVIDADGLYLISQKPEIVKDYPNLILTPNAMEFSNLVKTYLEKSVHPSPIVKTCEVKQVATAIGKNVVILHKGVKDVIVDSHKGSENIFCMSSGSGRRCGGQGDLVAGAVAVFWFWALSAGSSECALSPSTTACYAAARLVRECNAAAFNVKQRGTLTTDILEQIQPLFNRLYETHCEKSSFHATSRSRSADISK